ncbi:MAG: D-hexose-6-phosphate mutarotase [Nitrosomonadales bacterium]|jgi:glucose-6-phosphate 1-epimerase
MLNSKNIKIEKRNNLEILSINNNLATAEISLQGAHVSKWIPKNIKDDVLWLSSNAKFEKGRSIRGGVPIIWPWFGQHPTDNSYCIHGFARVIPWELIASEDLKNGSTKMLLRMLPTEIVKKQLTYEFQLDLTVIVGETLSLSLTTANKSQFPFIISEGFHTYFYISDIEKIRVTGLENVVYTDKVFEFNKGIERPEIQFNNEFDRVYMNTSNDCYIEDEGFKRVISIKKSNSNSTVIWTPWGKKASAMGDMGADKEWKRMVCVETVNALEDNVVIYPGKKHSIATEYSVQEY